MTGRLPTTDTQTGFNGFIAVASPLVSDLLFTVRLAFRRHHEMVVV